MLLQRANTAEPQTHWTHRIKAQSCLKEISKVILKGIDGGCKVMGKCMGFSSKHMQVHLFIYDLSFSIHLLLIVIFDSIQRLWFFVQHVCCFSLKLEIGPTFQPIMSLRPILYIFLSYQRKKKSRKNIFTLLTLQ